MPQHTNNKQVVSANSGVSANSSVRSEVFDDWVMLKHEKGSYFGDSDSEEEEEEDLNSLSEELLNAMLLESAGTNQIDEAKKLLALKNVDPKDSNKVDPQNPNKVNRNFIDENGNTALSHAVKAKNVEMMGLLLDSKANPNLKIKDGNTVLHYVTTVEVAKLLLAYKADINILNNLGQLPYHCTQRIPIFDQLGKPPRGPVKTYNNEALSLLLTPPQKLLDRELVQASIAKNHKKIKSLLEQKADPNTKTIIGTPLLHSATIKSDLSTIYLLLENNADITLKNKDGKTPLEIGKVYGKTLAVNLLKQELNNQLQLAVTKSNLSKVTELINMGADVNAQSPKGNTVLHYGISRNNKELVSLLLQNKADITIKNKDGLTALDVAQNIAKQIKNIEIINLLTSSHTIAPIVEEQKPNESKEVDITLEEKTELTPEEDNKDITQVQEEINKSHTGDFFQTLQHDATQNMIPLNPLLAGLLFEDLSEKSDYPTGEFDVMKEENRIDLLAGGCFDSITEEFYEEQRPEESEVIAEENESETQEKAILPAKQALNKHIEAIKEVPTEKQLHSQLEQLQEAITKKREIDYDKENIDSSALTQNPNEINNLITELAQATTEPAILNNLLIIATTQADNSTTELLAKNAVVNKDFLDQNGYSALHYAAIQGDIEKVNTLLKNGADINIKNKYGNTPLHAAVILKRTDVIKSLLEKGADVNAQDIYGNTAAHFAADAGDHEAIDLLHAKNADFTIQDHDGFTTLDHAIKSAQDTRDKIDSPPPATQDESSSKDSSNNSSSISSPQQYFYQKLLNLMHTVKNLVSKEEVKQQDNAKFLLDQQFLTTLKSLDLDYIHNKNSANPDILKFLDNVFKDWHEPTSTPAIGELMQPICDE